LFPVWLDGSFLGKFPGPKERVPFFFSPLGLNKVYTVGFVGVTGFVFSALSLYLRNLTYFKAFYKSILFSISYYKHSEMKLANYLE
jgi:hypothetical protein